MKGEGVKREKRELGEMGHIVGCLASELKGEKFVKVLLHSLKPRPNDSNISTQHIPTKMALHL